MNKYFIAGFEKTAEPLQEMKNYLLNKKKEERSDKTKKLVKSLTPQGAALGAIVGGGMSARKSIPIKGMFKRMGIGGLIGGAGGALLGALRSRQLTNAHMEDIRSAGPADAEDIKSIYYEAKKYNQ